MSPFMLFLIFGGYAAIYFGVNLATHSKNAGPFLYQATKLGQATYPGLANCG